MGTPIPSLQARSHFLASPGVQLQQLAALPISREFTQAIGGPLRSGNIEVFQMNLGKVCNQTCRHCHVDAGPDRRESMSHQTMEQCLKVLAETGIPTVDITGGAPELHPDFRWLVEQCRSFNRRVIDRCNLTVLELPAHRDLPDFFASHQVEVVCSLPHYRRMNTDRQRGEGVFEKSLSALKRLNDVGYGREGSDLRLVLVTNPVGAYLPGAQSSLEQEWKHEMDRLYGIRFNALYCITNMPISRYLEWLMVSNNLEGYMERLVNAFNPGAVTGLMCRHTISIGWDGRLYDCDFNQMLEIPTSENAPRHIKDFQVKGLEGREITVDRHCFGCTAGSGSSCGGATVS